MNFSSILASFLVLFASFFDTFSASIFGWFFGCHFFDFGPKMVAKGCPIGHRVFRIWRPQNAPKPLPRTPPEPGKTFFLLDPYCLLYSWAIRIRHEFDPPDSICKRDLEVEFTNRFWGSPVRCCFGTSFWWFWTCFAAFVDNILSSLDNLKIRKWETKSESEKRKRESKRKGINIDDDDDGEEVQHFLYIQTPDRPHPRLLC